MSTIENTVPYQEAIKLRLRLIRQLATKPHEYMTDEERAKNILLIAEQIAIFVKG
jgi:hypothetical protein